MSNLICNIACECRSRPLGGTRISVHTSDGVYFVGVLFEVVALNDQHLGRELVLMKKVNAPVFLGLVHLMKLNSFHCG